MFWLGLLYGFQHLGISTPLFTPFLFFYLFCKSHDDGVLFNWILNQLFLGCNLYIRSRNPST
uniref:Uncharacterized protein n=1 Tax=Rhizophora mucronata TaxID=61149 RepID=A0A2P2IH76_RHIMU